MAQDAFESVAEALEADDSLGALERLARVLVESIGKVEVAQVPPLAARLVDVLKRIGGSDLSALLWLRDGLASAVDRLADVQGMTSDKGKPLGTELAPMIRQLLEVLDALDASAGAMPGEGSPLDEISAARARRRDGGTAAASGL